MIQDFDFRSGKTLNTKFYSDKGILLHESSIRVLFSIYDNRRMLFGGIIEDFKTKHYNRDFHLPGSEKLDFNGIHDDHKLKLSNKRGIQLVFEKESNYFKPDGSIGYTSFSYGFHQVMSEEVKAKRAVMLANSTFTKDTSVYYVSNTGIYQFYSNYSSHAAEKHLDNDIIKHNLIVLDKIISKIID
jgi:hypothetical protein